MQNDPTPSLTKDAWIVMIGAYDEARMRGCERVAPEHIVFSLLVHPGSYGERFFSILGIEREKLLAELLKVAPRIVPDFATEPSLGLEAAGVLQRAVAESHRQGGTAVGVEHLLAGLITRVAGLAGNEPGVTSEFGFAISSALSKLTPQWRPEMSSLEPQKWAKSFRAKRSPVPASQAFTDPASSEIQLAREAAASIGSPVERTRSRRLRHYPTGPGLATGEWSSLPPGFGERCKALIKLARDEAARCRSPFVGTRHLLIAMVCMDGTIPRLVLDRAGVKVPRLRHAVRLICGNGVHTQTGRLDPSLLVRQVIMSAQLEADRLRSPLVEPEHLILALLRGERGIACGLLESMAIRLERLRKLVLLEIATADLDLEDPNESRK